jgi:hypothetical protein
MTDGAEGPVCFSKQIQAGREPAEGTRIGCCVLVGWLTDGAFHPVCFSKQSQAGREPAQAKGIGCCVLAGRMTDGAFGPICFSRQLQAGREATPGRGIRCCGLAGWIDRRGRRPRLLFKTSPGGKGAGTMGFKVRAWDPPGVRFRVKEKEQLHAEREATPGRGIGCCVLAGWIDRRGLRPCLLFKTTPGGKGAGTVGFKVRAWDPPGVRSRVKEKEPRGTFGRVCLSPQFLAARDPAPGT